MCVYTLYMYIVYMEVTANSMKYIEYLSINYLCDLSCN